MVESIGQLILKSCRILASGWEGAAPPPSLGSNAARGSLRAARAVCRLPVLEAGGRLKCLTEDFRTCPSGAFAARTLARKLIPESCSTAARVRSLDALRASFGYVAAPAFTDSALEVLGREVDLV